MNDGAWHQVVLSHRHLAEETPLFVDGKPAGSIEERIEPRRFVLGGPGDGDRGKAPAVSDYRDWFVWRAALNRDEAVAVADGRMVKASLEVYAPLNDEPLMKDRLIENRARSLAAPRAFPANAAAEVANLVKKQARASRLRDAELYPAPPRGIEVDPERFEAFVGTYKAKAPPVTFTVTREKDRLFFEDDGGRKAMLHAESETVYFILSPLERIAVAFLENDEGEVDRLVFSMGDDFTLEARRTR